MKMNREKCVQMYQKKAIQKKANKFRSQSQTDNKQIDKQNKTGHIQTDRQTDFRHKYSHTHTHSLPLYYLLLVL